MLIGLVISVISIAVVLLWFDAKRKGKVSKISNRFALIAAIIAIFGLILYIAVPSGSNSADNKSANSSTSSKTSQTKSDEEPSDDSERLNKLSSKKLAEFNSGMDNLLTDDQKDYSNGKDEYAWSAFAEKIQFSQQTGLTLYVTDNFQQLDNKERTLVGNKTQKLAKMQMVMMNLKTTPDYNLLRLNVHYGNHRIGHSKLTDSSEFKWSK